MTIVLKQTCGGYLQSKLAVENRSSAHLLSAIPQRLDLVYSFIHINGLRMRLELRSAFYIVSVLPLDCQLLIT